jgi:hypothetical protein
MWPGSAPARQHVNRCHQHDDRQRAAFPRERTTDRFWAIAASRIGKLRELIRQLHHARHVLGVGGVEHCSQPGLGPWLRAAGLTLSTSPAPASRGSRSRTGTAPPRGGWWTCAFFI